MSVRRKATAVAGVAAAPLVLLAFGATPASAHGTMTDPVSRVAACYAEGPENPTSAACKAAVAAGGKQALYDWNAVRDGDADGQSRTRIPGGKLCSAGAEEYKGLDLARSDWPATPLTAGGHTFHYKATAQHKGTFSLYMTNDQYDPDKPLTWSDLDAKPFAEVTDPKVVDGDYVFDGTVPARSGRQLVYSVWQRSDSPEAFYTCSDVVFGKDGGSASPTPSATASAPTDQQIAAGAERSSMSGMAGMGGMGEGSGHSATPSADGGSASAAAGGGGSDADGGGARPDGAAGRRVDGTHLAETGSAASTAPLAVGGAAVLAAGAAVLLLTARRRAARHHG